MIIRILQQRKKNSHTDEQRPGLLINASSPLQDISAKCIEPIPALRQLGPEITTQIQGQEEYLKLEEWPLLDSQQGERTCGSIDLLRDMLTLLLHRELPSNLAQLKKAFRTGDKHSLGKTAHKIKGGAVYIGTLRMKYACQYLESYLKSGQDKFINPLYHQTIAVIEDTSVAVNNWLKSQSACTLIKTVDNQGLWI